MKSFKLWSLAIVLLSFTAISSAQTVQEVVDTRNKGAELMSAGNLDGAITELEKCVDLAKKVGADADEYRLVAEGALPDLYLKKAGDVVDSKDYPAALKAFDAAIAAAQKYNNPEVKEKAEKTLPMVHYAMGAAAYQKNDFDAAIKSLDQATMLDPDFVKAYFMEGAIYQKQNNEAKMAENYKLAIAKGEGSNEAKNAKNALRNYYFNGGITAMKVKKWDDAIASFTKAVDADDTYADAYYRMSSCYNNKSSWDNAITNGEKALELRAGSDSKVTDGIYYELGTAYAGKKDNGKACESFKKVVNEPYLKGAKYQIETALKCK